MLGVSSSARCRVRSFAQRSQGDDRPWAEPARQSWPPSSPSPDEPMRSAGEPSARLSSSSSWLTVTGPVGYGWPPLSKSLAMFPLDLTCGIRAGVNRLSTGLERVKRWPVTFRRPHASLGRCSPWTRSAGPQVPPSAASSCSTRCSWPCAAADRADDDSFGSGYAVRQRRVASILPLQPS